MKQPPVPGTPAAPENTNGSRLGLPLLLEVAFLNHLLRSYAVEGKFAYKMVEFYAQISLKCVTPITNQIWVVVITRLTLMEASLTEVYHSQGRKHLGQVKRHPVRPEQYCTFTGVYYPSVPF
jgi:hypothetical protein